MARDLFFVCLNTGNCGTWYEVAIHQELVDHDSVTTTSLWRHMVGICSYSNRSQANERSVDCALCGPYVSPPLLVGTVEHNVVDWDRLLQGVVAVETDHHLLLLLATTEHLYSHTEKISQP